MLLTWAKRLGFPVVTIGVPVVIACTLRPSLLRTVLFVIAGVATLDVVLVCVLLLLKHFTEKRLRAYAESQKAQHPNWEAITPTKEELRELSRRGTAKIAGQVFSLRKDIEHKSLEETTHQDILEERIGGKI